MPSIKGKVRKVFQNDDKWRMLVTVEGDESLSNTYFSGFGSCPFKEGDYIDGEYKTTTINGKTYHNIGRLPTAKEAVEQVKTKTEKIEIQEKYIHELKMKALGCAMTKHLEFEEEIKLAEDYLAWLVRKG